MILVSVVRRKKLLKMTLISVKKVEKRKNLLTSKLRRAKLVKKSLLILKRRGIQKNRLKKNVFEIELNNRAEDFLGES